MAYAHTITARRRIGEGREFIQITETDTGTGSEWGPVPVAPACKLLAYRVTRTSGSAAAEVNPVLGRAESWTADDEDHLLTADWGTTTPGTRFATSAEAVLVTSGGELYGRTKPNVGGDTFVTELVIGVP